MTGVADGAKLKVVKAVRKLLPDLTLMESKKMVDKLPVNIKEGVAPEEGEAMKAALVEAGAEVTLA